MEADYIDFTVEDEMSSITLVIEDQHLYVHKEVLAAWSPVFRSMFTRNFKEKEQREIELPDKKVDEFIELLHCMYPPIKPVTGELHVFENQSEWVLRLYRRDFLTLWLPQPLLSIAVGFVFEIYCNEINDLKNGVAQSSRLGGWREHAYFMAPESSDIL